MTAVDILRCLRAFPATLAFLAALGVCGPSTNQTAAQTAGETARAEKYVHAWADLNSALVHFSIASGEFEADRSRPAASRWQPYEVHRKRFAEALLVLRKTRPPPDHVLKHWTLVPLFGDLLAGMTVITQGIRRNEPAIEERGWVWFGMTVAILKEAVNEIESR